MYKKILFFLLLAVVGCKDEEDPVCLLKKVNIYVGITLEHSYDLVFVDEELVAVTGLVDNQGSEKETWFLTRSADKRITEVFYEADGATTEDRWTYTYDGNVRNVEFAKTSGADTVIHFETAEFYLHENPVDGIYYLNEEFLEMQGGNIIRSGLYSVINGENVINPSGQVTYTYDDKENLLRDFFETPNLLNMPFRMARINSKNNLLVATRDQPITNIYKFDNSDNLLNFIDGDTGIQLTFSYNCK